MYEIIVTLAVNVGKKTMSPSMAGHLLRTSNIKIVKTVASKVLLEQRRNLIGYLNIIPYASRIFSNIISKI